MHHEQSGPAHDETNPTGGIIRTVSGRLVVIRTAMLAAGLGLGFCPGLDGADIKINLLVRAGGRQQSMASAQPGGARSRLAAKVGEILLVQWSATNPETASALSDVTLH